MNLSPRKKTDRVLERSTTMTDQHGEIQRFDRTEVVLKNKEREDFFLLFTKHVAVLGNLGKRAHEVLSIILQSKVTWNNDVLLDSVSKNEIATELNTSVQVIKNAVTELIKHDIILTKKVEGGWKYMLNPHLFGRGKWNEIEAMKIQITKEFDFKNQYFIETVDTMTAYEGLPEKKDIKLLGSTEIETEKGTIKSTLIEDMSISHDDCTEIIDINVIPAKKEEALRKLREFAKTRPLKEAALSAQSSFEIREAGEAEE